MNRQLLAIASFVGGLVTFLGTAIEILSQHHAWSEFTATPLGAAHLCVLSMAFVTLVAGALGIQLPRTGREHGDRADDPPPSSLPPSV